MTRDKDPKLVPAAPAKGDAPEVDALAEEVSPLGEQEPEAEEVPRDHLHVTEVYRQNLARNMKRLRKKLKLTQVDLGERIGVGQGQITMLERGKVDASLKSLTRIAQGLETDPMELLAPPPTSDLIRLPWTEMSLSEQEWEARPGPQAAPSAVTRSVESRATREEQNKPPPIDATRGAGLPPGPDAVLSSLGQGLSLTVAKHIAGAVHKRLVAMERRHGSVPMTRSMLNALLVAMLNASQNLDYANEEETVDRP